MRFLFASFTLFQFCFLSSAQIEISGQVLNESDTPILGANVFLEGSYDGATTDDHGKFSFEVNESPDGKVLVIKYLGFDSIRMVLQQGQTTGLQIVMRELPGALNAVIINAGSFSAGEDTKATVLKPLDIVTTAGAAGDVFGALQTLPGASPNPEDGRLFVRGGDARETSIFIDGIKVFTPFTASVGNVPVRGRFSPFLFDGVTFSTGGFSAEYGNTLSGVVLLETTDVPDEEKTELSIMTVGGSVGHTEIFEKSSISGTVAYTNLDPYMELVPQNNRFTRAIQAVSGETVYRHKVNNGLIKGYAAFSYGALGILQDDLDSGENFEVSQDNRNFYTNLTIEKELGKDWDLDSGMSFSNDHTDVSFATSQIESLDTDLHAKLKFSKRHDNYFLTSYGVEQYLHGFQQTFQDTDLENQNDIRYGNSGIFSEAQLFINKDFAIKGGMRADWYSNSGSAVFSPRLSAAYQFSKSWQTSVAFGYFAQNIRDEVLQYNSSLRPSSTTQSLINVLYNSDDRMLRAEFYHKDYDALVTYDGMLGFPETRYMNSGDGYATGLDLFWRDEKSIDNLDYWVSYSYVDTQRLQNRFRESATPPYVTDHTFSVVGKYWIDSLRSQAGLSFSFASGRPYDNPASQNFLGERTKSFQSLNLNWAYLIDDQKILYASATNVLGRKNIFGYRYSSTPDMAGNFSRQPILPAADQFFFVGFFWTIGGTDNQLDNL